MVNLTHHRSELSEVSTNSLEMRRKVSYLLESYLIKKGQKVFFNGENPLDDKPISSFQHFPRKLKIIKLKKTLKNLTKLPQQMLKALLNATF